MKRERLWWETPGWIALAVTVIVLLQAQGSAQAPVAVAGENSLERSGIEDSQAIPFTLQDGYLIVMEGWIGAHRHLRLLLDTGATHSVLRSDLADEQEFVRRPTRMVNLDHVLTQELVEVPNFELGPIRIARLPMLLHDLAYLRETGPGVDGVIGLDVLRLRSFRHDSALSRPVGKSIAGTESGAADSRGKSGGSRVAGSRHAASGAVERHQPGTARSVVAKLAGGSSAGSGRLPVADFPGSSALQFRLRKEHLQLGVSRGGWQRFLHSILSEVTFCLSDTFGSFPSLLGCWLLAKHRHSTGAADKAVSSGLRPAKLHEN